MGYTPTGLRAFVEFGYEEAPLGGLIDIAGAMLPPIAWLAEAGPFVVGRPPGASVAGHLAPRHAMQTWNGSAPLSSVIFHKNLAHVIRFIGNRCRQSKTLHGV